MFVHFFIIIRWHRPICDITEYSDFCFDETIIGLGLKLNLHIVGLLIATSPEDLQELINRVRASSEKVGLLINTDRTKVMACGNSGMNTKYQPVWRSSGRSRIICVFGLSFHQ